MVAIKICSNLLALCILNGWTVAFQTHTIHKNFLTSSSQTHRRRTSLAYKPFNNTAEVIEATIIDEEKAPQWLEQGIMAELEKRIPSTPADVASSTGSSNYNGGMQQSEFEEHIFAELERRRQEEYFMEQMQSFDVVPNQNEAQKVWDESAHARVPGEALKTWSFTSKTLKRIQVEINTEGHPLDADVDLWQGPDRTPQKMRVYNEDGALRPFSFIMETLGASTVAIQNTADMAHPFDAHVSATVVENGFSGTILSQMGGTPTTIQGRTHHSFPFEPMVESVQVLLMTDGRPLNARIELLQGPLNMKQVIELYTEDGLDRPFYALIETPGKGNSVRVINTADSDFPFTAWVEPYIIGSHNSDEYGPTTELVLGP